jgi:glycosyltransferase involved in cell wall biosynthesis
MKLMNALNLSYNNICGICTTLSNGLNKYSKHQCRCISITPDPYDNEIDIIIKNDQKKMQEYVNTSEILHLNSWYFSGFTIHHPMLIFKLMPLSFVNYIDRLSNFHKIPIFSKFFTNSENIWWHWYMAYVNKHKINGKKILLHYHGSDVRIDMSEVDLNFIKKNNLKTIVSIPDIIPYFENAEWLPIPVPTNDELLKPKSKRDDTVIKIVHCPTNREAKKTEALIRAVDLLKKKFDVELLLLENIPYKHCLELKREAHISFDNIQYGSYAGCSIEAMCHEQPSLVYLGQVTLKEIDKVSKKINIECPLINVGDTKQPGIEYLNKVMNGRARNIITTEDIQSIYLKLRELVENDTLRKEIGKKGRKWASMVHDEKVVVEKLTNIYESLEEFKRR